MVTYAQDDLISFASDDGLEVATPFAPPPPPPSLSRTVHQTEGVRPAPMPSDNFADLTGLMRSKKPYSATTAQQRALSGLGEQKSSPLFRRALSAEAPSFQPAQSLLGENAFQSRTLAQPYFHRERLAVPETLQPTESTVTKPSNLPKPDYDECLMSRLDRILEEAAALNIEENDEKEKEQEQKQDSSLSELLTEIDAPQPPAAFNILPQAYTHQVNRLGNIDENEPIVRLTQDTWGSCAAQISTLRKEKHHHLEQLYSLQRQLSERIEGETTVSSDVGKLRYQLQAGKDYNAAMSRDIRQKDIEISRKELEIDSLKKEVDHLELLQKNYDKCTAELSYLRTARANEQEAHSRAISQVEAIKDKEIAGLKSAAAHSRATMTDQTIRAKNLVETQAYREKIIKNLQENLNEERNVSNKLRSELDDIRSRMPSQLLLKKLQDQLGDSQSQLDKTKNDLKVTARNLELSQQSIRKLEDKTASLRGAAHLIIPSADTRLPKLVLSCMECYLKNIDCDPRARCLNCTNEDKKCMRWRCSLRHVLHECHETPCRFFHDINGWLMERQQRPQW